MAQTGEFNQGYNFDNVLIGDMAAGDILTMDLITMTDSYIVTIYPEIEEG